MRPERLQRLRPVLAVLAGGALFGALLLTTQSPGWLFWGLTAVSCAAAFTWACLGDG